MVGLKHYATQPGKHKLFMQNTKYKKKRTSPEKMGKRPFNKDRRRTAKKNQRVSNLKPEQLIQKAVQTEIQEYQAERSINDLPVSANLKECLVSKGFQKPTEIQDKTLEALLKGNDLLGIAQTGTGKTGAFLIPIIEQLLQHRKKSYALIVVPTRELATQVEDEFRSMTKNLGLYCTSFIGGTNINRDMMNLKRQSHVVIGTPGRLLDLVDRRALKLTYFNTLVLDEFDRMLDMGFVHDVKKLIAGMEKRKQSLLFSATLDKTQETMISQILNNPVTVKVSSGEATSEHIEQDIIRLQPGEDKLSVLIEMLRDDEFQKVILFEETKHKVSRLCDKLNRAGIKSEQIHGNKSQNQRQNALNAFKQGKAQVLVATDVAARGIDVSDVTHVINYQMPLTFDSYIHRIGRTGRAGKVGKAFTFVD